MPLFGGNEVAFAHTIHDSVVDNQIRNRADQQRVGSMHDAGFVTGTFENRCHKGALATAFDGAGGFDVTHIEDEAQRHFVFDFTRGIDDIGAINVAL